MTNLSGPVYEERIGSYQLGLQYQKGLTELKNFTFTNTLNFRDALRLTTSYLRKDAGVLNSNYPIADNRFSIMALYYVPYLPSLTFGYETGDTRIASSEGINKYDKKAEFGATYSLGGTNVSAKYVKSVLYDNTYLASSNNLINKNNILTLNGASDIGGLVYVFGTYFDQQTYNQVGNSALYNQRVQDISLFSDVKMFPFLTFKPGFTSRVNYVDYDIPAGQKDHQKSQKTDLIASLKPNERFELVFGGGTGPIEFEDSNGYRKQDLTVRQGAFNSNPIGNIFLNMELREEAYAGGTQEGRVAYFNVYLFNSPSNGLKVSLKKNSTSFSGTVYTVATGGIRSQDVNEGNLELSLPRNFFLAGGASYTQIDVNKYAGISTGLRYSPAASNNFEIRREGKLGYESAQNVYSQTDSFKLNMALGVVNINEQFYLITNQILSGATPGDFYGYRNYAEAKAGWGDSSISCTVNSEKQDQNSSAYTRTYLSFTRSF